MLAYFWFVLALFLSSTLAGEEETAKANDYIDQVLENVKNSDEFFCALEAFGVPKIEVGSLTLINLWAHGLSIQRSGDCILSNDGDKVKMEINAEVPDVFVKTMYEYQTIFLLRGIIEAETHGLSIRLAISLSHKENNAKVEEFKVTHFGDIHVTKATGMKGLSRMVLKLVVDSLANDFKGKIVEMLESTVPNIITEELSKIKIGF